MARINTAEKIIHCQIAYYGTDMSGKMTTLAQIHQHFPIDSRSRIDYIDDPYTMYFHGVHSNTVHGFQIYFHLRTNPGAVVDKQERTAILEDADGIVLVIDSQPHKLKENRYALNEMLSTIRLYGRDPKNFPIVLQYNKRDLPNALSVDKLDKEFNKFQWQRFESIATTGMNVMETFNTICVEVIAAL
jgi:signal recognition particle receptor subunit beta